MVACGLLWQYTAGALLDSHPEVDDDFATELTRAAGPDRPPTLAGAAHRLGHGDRLGDGRTHAEHPHVHGEGRGHVAVRRGDHIDHVRDGHRHVVHEGYWGDC